MKTKVLLTTLTGILLVAGAFCADDRPVKKSLIDDAVPSSFWNRRAATDGPVKGYVEWKDRYRSGATEWDKTDFWAAIAISPSTGKYASSCEYRPFDLAERAAREKCNAPDARAVVLCGNGWCALALGDEKPGKDFGWGVGWAAEREKAERFALESARERKLPGAKVVYSIYSREPRTGGAIAYSESTGNWGYSTGGGRHAPYMALQNCKAPDAKIIAQKDDCWMALALGDDKSVYGWGYAGNRADAERNALEQCRQRAKNPKIAFSFCTNGVAH
jgi:hypothetical protein